MGFKHRHYLSCGTIFDNICAMVMVNTVLSILENNGIDYTISLADHAVYTFSALLPTAFSLLLHLLKVMQVNIRPTLGINFL